MATVTDIATLIVRSPDTCGDRPRISGTRLSVEQIVVLHQQGLSATDMISEYQGLKLEQVYAALAYYYANQAEIERYLSEDEAEYEHLLIEQASASN